MKNSLKKSGGGGIESRGSEIGSGGGVGLGGGQGGCERRIEGFLDIQKKSGGGGGSGREGGRMDVNEELKFL